MNLDCESELARQEERLGPIVCYLALRALICTPQLPESHQTSAKAAQPAALLADYLANFALM